MHASDSRELTPRAVLLGIVLAVVLAGANAYLGLFAGMTVSASIPAAVISMGLLALLGNSTIRENNMVQTAASAGESIAAGVIFTIPALVIMDYWQVFDYWWVSMIAGLGGLLGVLFSIPLRRSLILGEKLVFPEGTATAEVLEVGQGRHTGLAYLAWAALIGAGVKFCETGIRLWSAVLEGATQLGGMLVYGGSNLSPALLSVGYIVRLNIAVLVFAGGSLAWFIAIPLYYALAGDTDPLLRDLNTQSAAATDIAWTIWTTQIRYLGVGAMLIGGIWALISMGPSITQGIRDGLHQYRNSLRDRDAAAVPREQRDLPMNLVLIGVLLCVLPLFWLYQEIVGTITVSAPMTLVMVTAGFLFSAVAAYMAGLVGSSNNPISGVTIATILLSALLLAMLMGPSAPNGAAAAIMIGAVVCSAAAISGDNMQDLKTGYLVGATPWRQQIMQFVGTISAVLVMAPILTLLLKAYGFGSPTDAHPHALPAPQATLMASVAQGVFGEGLPWRMVWMGAGIGALVIGVDEWLKRRSSHWRAPVLAVAVGIYLPFELSVPILLGGLIAQATAKGSDTARRHGMLFAAGLITGEALVGILLAIPIVVSGNPDVLALANAPFGGLPGVLVMGAVMLALFRVSRGTR